MFQSSDIPGTAIDGRSFRKILSSIHLGEFLGNDSNLSLFYQGLVGQWMDCDGVAEEPLSDSTFALIIAPTRDYYASSDVLTKRLLKVMRHGAIPVILGESCGFLENHVP